MSLSLRGFSANASCPVPSPLSCSQFVCQAARDRHGIRIRAKGKGRAHRSGSRCSLYQGEVNPGVSFGPWGPGPALPSETSRPEYIERLRNASRPRQFPQICPRCVAMCVGDGRVACLFAELITPAAQLTAHLWLGFCNKTCRCRKITAGLSRLFRCAITCVECARLFLAENTPNSTTHFHAFIGTIAAIVFEGRSLPLSSDRVDIR